MCHALNTYVQVKAPDLPPRGLQGYVQPQAARRPSSRVVYQGRGQGSGRAGSRAGPPSDGAPGALTQATPIRQYATAIPCIASAAPRPVGAEAAHEGVA